MNRKTIIVIITPTSKIECWGNLKKACNFYRWAYSTLSKYKLPVFYKGYKIYRIPFL